MNNPLEILYGEHEIIKSALGITKTLKELSIKKTEEYEDTVRRLLVFFRGFADEYHHFKEEQILFPEMARKNELLAEGIIKEMNDNHEDFRKMLSNIEEFLNIKNYSSAQAELEKYTELLLDHIAVENEEVFQVADSLFNSDELEKIGFRFQDIDRDFGNTRKISFVEIVEMIGEDLE
jgi:hemerythrin-like domain-containing protein